jgi:hypothetical protein
MGTIAIVVVILAIALSLAFTKVVGGRIRDQARAAKAQEDPDALPEQ